MITIISPAKIFRTLEKQEYKTYNPLKFHEESVELIELLKRYTEPELAKLMKMSDELAKINSERYKNFTDIEEVNAYEALLYFYGEAYKGLEASTLDQPTLAYLHEHVCILSGLYGVIQPLECIKPYRLEMGTKFTNSVGKDLYAFWKDRLTTHMMKALERTTGDQILLNLASDEYSKALQLKIIQKQFPVIKVSFKEKKGDSYKVVGMYAKKARGLMVRYIGENRIDTIEAIKSFNEDGYELNIEESSEEHFVFTR